MRLILLMLILAACSNFPRRDSVPVPDPIPEPRPIEQPAPKRERPVTIITVNPPAKTQPICVPMAASERKQILQALECLIEADKPKK
jgi:hypothetical protein